MANQLSTQQEINLVSGLNLNKNKAEINTAFAGFNKRNAPRYGGCISPFFTKELSESAKVITDSSGNEYRVDNEGNFYVNDIWTKKLTKQGFLKTYITPPFGAAKWTKYGDYTKFAYVKDDGTFIVDDATVGTLPITANLGVMEVRDWGNYVIAAYAKSVHDGDSHYDVTTSWIIYDTVNKTTKTGTNVQQIVDGTGLDGAPTSYLVGYITIVGQTIPVDGVDTDCFLIQPNTAVKYTGHCLDGDYVDISYSKSTTSSAGGDVSFTSAIAIDANKIMPYVILAYDDTSLTIDRVGHICRDGYIYAYTTHGTIDYKVKVSSVDDSVVTYTESGYTVTSSDSLWDMAYPFTPSFKISGSAGYPEVYPDTSSYEYTQADPCIPYRAYCSEWLYSYDQALLIGASDYISGNLNFANSNENDYDANTWVAKHGTSAINVGAIALGKQGSRLYTNNNVVAGHGFSSVYESSSYYSRTSTLQTTVYIQHDSSGTPVDYDTTVNQSLPYIAITYLGGLTVPLSSHFRLLINGNQPVGISYFNNEGEIGTLLTPWNSVNDDADTDIKVFGDTVVYYSSTEKRWIQLSVSANAFDFDLVEDSYIIFNTTDIDNVYIISSEDFDHYASDWNNRGTLGTPEDPDWTESELITHCCTDTHTASFASAYNNNYTSTGIGVISSQFQPVLLAGGVVLSSATQPGTLFDANGVTTAVYYGIDTETTTLSYSYSYADGTKTTDLSLVGTDYVYASSATEYIRCPSIFATYIETMLTEDWIKDGKVYKLLGIATDERVYILGYATVATNNAEVVFAIQGQPFLVSNSYIYSVTTVNNVIYTSPVVKISNMQYIGNSPTAAYFFSPLNRVIYTFKGDRSLTPSFIASEIDSINLYGYDASTSTLYLVSDSKVYCFVDNVEGLDMYTINQSGVTDLYFSEDGITVVDAEKSTLYSYINAEDLTSNGVEIQTQYFGAGNNRVSVIDCYYIRLFTETVEAGNITCGVETITNTGRQSEKRTFHITKDMWDSETNTYYLRYQPKYQRGMGESLYIKSDFPIMSISCGVTPDSTIQISKGGI